MFVARAVKGLDNADIFKLCATEAQRCSGSKPEHVAGGDDVTIEVN